MPPLDAGLGQMLDRRGRGYATSEGVDILMPQSSAPQRLGMIFDLLAECILPRKLVFSLEGRALCEGLAAAGRLHDLTWYATADRDMMMQSASAGRVEQAMWSLERLASRGGDLSVCLYHDTGEVPPESSGLELSQLNTQNLTAAGIAGLGESLQHKLEVNQISKADPVPQVAISSGAVKQSEGFDAATKLEDVAQDWQTLSDDVTRHIGALEGAVIGGFDDQVRYLVVEQNPVGGADIALSLQNPTKVRDIWMSWN